MIMLIDGSANLIEWYRTEKWTVTKVVTKPKAQIWKEFGIKGNGIKYFWVAPKMVWQGIWSLMMDRQAQASTGEC